ncbi:hypothetical protein [Thioalkalivibrio sp. XN279]|uniref:hypothetical protein n=1 Tax=Thioalkalivibrio sp. XN279 TaxID=2714953 RepID=UPI00140AB85A|nr:hypothetical protein [Thioalkalivibrio sp. XN279]NHA14605.1 hypothetical protein [Thioalkalivibrio sp. XN279]
MSKFALVLPVPDPGEAARYLRDELESAGSPWMARGNGGAGRGPDGSQTGEAAPALPEVSVQALSDGRVLLRVPAHDAYLEALRTNGFDVQPHDGMVEILLVPEKTN